MKQFNLYIDIRGATLQVVKHNVLCSFLYIQYYCYFFCHERCCFIEIATKSSVTWSNTFFIYDLNFICT